MRPQVPLIPYVIIFILVLKINTCVELWAHELNEDIGKRDNNIGRVYNQGQTSFVGAQIPNLLDKSLGSRLTAELPIS